MIEALKAIIQFGFEIIGLNRIEATVDFDNLASISLLNKLGFTEEGIIKEYNYSQEQFTELKLFLLLS